MPYVSKAKVEQWLTDLGYAPGDAALLPKVEEFIRYVEQRDVVSSDASDQAALAAALGLSVGDFVKVEQLALKTARIRKF